MVVTVWRKIKEKSRCQVRGGGALSFFKGWSEKAWSPRSQDLKLVKACFVNVKGKGTTSVKPVRVLGLVE